MKVVWVDKDQWAVPSCKVWDNIYQTHCFWENCDIIATFRWLVSLMVTHMFQMQATNRKPNSKKVLKIKPPFFPHITQGKYRSSNWHWQDKYLSSSMNTTFVFFWYCNKYNLYWQNSADCELTHLQKKTKKQTRTICIPKWNIRILQTVIPPPPPNYLCFIWIWSVMSDFVCM